MSITELRHLYGADNEVHRAFDLKAYVQHLHVPYGHWLAINTSTRKDFITAVADVARQVYSDWVMSGSPDLRGMNVTLTQSQMPAVVPDEGGVARYHLEDGLVNSAVDVSMLRQHLAELLIVHMNAMFVVREFPEASYLAATALVYAHETGLALGVLPGQRATDLFFKEPVR